MPGLFAEKVLALACAIQQRALVAETLDEMSRAAAAFLDTLIAGLRRGPARA